MLKTFAHTLLLISLITLSPMLCAQSGSGANQKLSIDPPSNPDTPQSPDYDSVKAGTIHVELPQIDHSARNRINQIAQNIDTDGISPTSIELPNKPQGPTVEANIDPTTDETAITPTTEKPDRALNERQTNPVTSSNFDTDNPNSYKSQTSSYLLQTLTALGVVIGLMFLLKWIYSKATGHVSAHNTSVVQVLARTPIAPRNHIVILRIGSRILVCSDSSHGTRTLTEITDSEEVAEMLAHTSAAKENSLTKSFNHMLGRYGADYDSKGRHPDEGLDTVEFQSDSARESVSKLLTRVRDMAGKGGSR